MARLAAANWGAFVALPLLALATPTAPGIAPEELSAGDECLAAGDEGGGCGLSALQRRGARLAAEAEPPALEATRGRVACSGLEAPENEPCRKTVEWFAGANGKGDPRTKGWFDQMRDVTGVSFPEASVADLQRLYFCAPPGGVPCGSPPCHCSKPPCGTCFGGAAPLPVRQCEAGQEESIACKPPASALAYRGSQWPTMSFPGAGEMHIFAIGDWGGMDGSLNPIEGRPLVVAYDWGRRPGPSVFARTRWNKMHDEELCTHKQFVECFDTRGQPPCAEGCGYVAGVDDQPQQLVAAALKERAALKDPQYLLNVGDNFYWGGIERTCGTPMDQISYTAHHQFSQIFEGMYGGPGLDGKPWLSVLGNHDWGGRVFNNGWDQQIAYTWTSNRWVLPAPYWYVRVEYPDQDFSVDVFFTDSNFIDAQDPPEDPEHNLCGSKHNPPDANCSLAGGPSSVESCKDWFQELWSQQQPWLERHLSESSATWQVVVTHFPCGHEQEFYARLRGLGLDLLVTGHRHDQELWLPEDTAKNHMGGLTCIVTGGGGGITSEATPDPSNTTDWYGEGQYGFYDLTINGSMIFVESINWNGTVLATSVVRPS